MVTLTRPAYYDNYRYAQYCGLSTDNKSTISASNGDEYYEIDTAKIYIYNEASNEWIVQPDDTTAIDTGLPPITSETMGHFLSNDGSVTKWQSIASKNFVINLNEGLKLIQFIHLPIIESEMKEIDPEEYEAKAKAMNSTRGNRGFGSTGTK